MLCPSPGSKPVVSVSKTISRMLFQFLPGCRPGSFSPVRGRDPSPCRSSPHNAPVDAFPHPASAAPSRASNFSARHAGPRQHPLALHMFRRARHHHRIHLAHPRRFQTAAEYPARRSARRLLRAENASRVRRHQRMHQRFQFFRAPPDRRPPAPTSAARSTAPSFTAPGKASAIASTAAPPLAIKRVMAASESCTGTPSAANSLAVSLLPMPMRAGQPDDIGPMRMVSACSSAARRPGRDLRPDAEKSFERRHRLMHQHAQPIDGTYGRAPWRLSATRFPADYKQCPAPPPLCGSGARSSTSGALPRHAGAGGVDQQRGLARQHWANRSSGPGTSLALTMRLQSLAPGFAALRRVAVENMDLGRAQFIQRQHRAPRRAARAQQQHGSFRCDLPKLLAQAFRKPDSIGVAAFDSAIA